MNSRDRIDNIISFMFNASNISWHIIMKARITITAFDKDKKEAKGKKKTRNGTWLELGSYNEQTQFEDRNESPYFSIFGNFHTTYTRKEWTYMSRIDLVSKNWIASKLFSHLSQKK